MISWYQAKLASRPFLTQVVTTAVLFGAGDVLAQQAVEKRGYQGHDVMRTFRMTAYGGLIFGPAVTKWYPLLQKHINLSSRTRTVAARVAVDQFVFSPIHMAVFLSTIAALEGASPQARLREKYVKALGMNWTVWPAVQLLNFSIVPLEHRVLVVNVVSLGWNCYLSFLNNQGS